MTPPPAPEPSHWEIRGHKLLAHTPIFDLHSTHFHHPVRKCDRDFVIIDAPDWVNVIALTKDDHIVLVRQFRFGIDALSLEIPGGVMERGEEPLAAGLRELQEETGYTGTAPILLGQIHPNPAVQNNRTHFVLVDGAELTHPHAWDPDEELQTMTLPAADVFALARNGGITHSLVVNALLLFEPIWRARQR